MPLFRQRAKRFAFEPSVEGLRLVIARGDLAAIRGRDADPNLLEQYVQLKMLEEQGLATETSFGFLIETDLALHLDEDARELLELPDDFPGSIDLRIRGQADQEGFSVGASVQLPGMPALDHYELLGPLLQLSSEEFYLLQPAEHAGLLAIQQHGDSAKQEQDNLRLIANLQRAKAGGMRVDLAHFEDIQVHEPETVKLTVTRTADGGLELVPNYGLDLDPDAIDARLHQIPEGQTVGSLRIGSHRVSLDERCIQATREILGNRKIPSEQVEQFIETPSAFINASLVDLDDGFSLRVRGIAEFKQRYFGDTEESGINWFGADEHETESPSPKSLSELIRTEAQLNAFIDAFDEAVESQAAAMEFDGQSIEISDVDSIQKQLDEIAREIFEAERDRPPEIDETEDTAQAGKGVIDIQDNDEFVEFGHDHAIEQILYKEHIDSSNLALTPFTYQETGIRWILGQSEKCIGLDRNDLGTRGALLADDMGLGKTFMSLAAIEQYQKLVEAGGQQQKPVLVVAPLSLLENWKDEVEKSFKNHEAAFTDIVILQADKDLTRFKVQGVGRESAQSADATLESINYALKVGRVHSTERLDMPKRLVLTTYQTLRDYQFSLARVDWSFVIFDEAQQIKNPNTLQSHAAKALKANFKLLATGTPVENTLKDFWNLMDAAVPGHLSSYQDFNKTYIKPILKASLEERSTVRLEVGNQLRSRVGSLMLRRVKEDELEGLPNKRIFVGVEGGSERADFDPVLRCEMSHEQRSAYESVIESHKQSSQEADGRAHALSALKRLRDVSLHPSLLEGGHLPYPTSRQHAEQLIAESAKLKQTFSLLKSIGDRGEKAIIFCINKKLQQFLAAACEAVFGGKVSIINGDTKAVAKRAGVATRKSLIKEFEATEGFAVIVMSPIAAGMGLTVVGANNVIHLERHWNPAKEAQATDRVYRIGQERDVNIYLPILAHPANEVQTFDENLHHLLMQKTALGDAVVTPEEVTPDELQKGVFGFDVESSDSSFSIDDLQTMDWKIFEAFVAVLAAKVLDSSSQLTKDGADNGADVIVHGSETVLIQCKHTSRDLSPAAGSVREVYSARPMYEQRLDRKVKSMLVVTNSKRLSKDFRTQSKASGVKYWRYQDLKKHMASFEVNRSEVLGKLDAERFSLK